MILAILALSCPEIVVVNTSGLEWNAVDQDTLMSAKSRCVKIYPDAPCLKWFRKYDFQAYDAICGYPTKS